MHSEVVLPPYRILASPAGLPELYDHYRKHAVLVDEIDLDSSGEIMASIHLSRDSINCFSEPPGALHAQKTLIEPYMVHALTGWGRRRWTAKPVEETLALSPPWLPELSFSVALLLSVVEAILGISRVDSLQFVNPPSGPSLLDEDLVPMYQDVVSAAARALLGSAMDDGRIVINGEWETGFACDCRGRVDVTLYVPGHEQHLAQERIEAAASRCAATSGIEYAIAHVV